MNIKRSSVIFSNPKARVGFFSALALAAVSSFSVYASGSNEAFNISMLWIAILLLLAKFAGTVERIGLPAVLGELGIGIILGNLFYVGINVFEPVKQDSIIAFLAYMGVIILLFEAGLESNVKEMRKTGLKAIMVACAAAAIPFLVGLFIIGPVFLPQETFNTHLFIGAALTTSSVGIAATLFKQYNKMRTAEARIVLGAAVMDDILGMIILPIIISLITTGSVTVGGVVWLAVRAIAFLFFSIYLGQLFSPQIGKFFSKVNPGMGMKFTMALGIGLIFAYLSTLMEMAPIIGAFAAGLFLDPVHFKDFDEPEVAKEVKQVFNKKEYDFQDNQRNAISYVISKHSDKHIEELLIPLSHFMIPLFFVTIGMKVDVRAMMDINNLIIAIGICCVAVVCRMLAALFAGKEVNKLLVGVALVPNGEVGLVYLAIGDELGAINDVVFTKLLTVMVITTIVAPVVLDKMLRQIDNPQETPRYAFLPVWNRVKKYVAHRRSR